MLGIPAAVPAGANECDVFHGDGVSDIRMGPEGVSIRPFSRDQEKLPCLSGYCPSEGQFPVGTRHFYAGGVRKKMT